MSHKLVRQFFRDHIAQYLLAIFSIGVAKMIQVQIPHVIGDFIQCAVKPCCLGRG